MEPLQRKNVLCCLLFILSLILTQRAFNITGNAWVLHCLRVLGDNTKEQATSSVYVKNGSVT